MLGVIEETSAYLRSVASSADRVANALARVEEITCAWEDVVLASKAIRLVACDQNNAEVAYTLTWAAEALESFAAQSMEFVQNPHNSEEELARRFARDPELLLRIWDRIEKLRLPRHPLEV